LGLDGLWSKRETEHTCPKNNEESIYKSDNIIQGCSLRDDDQSDTKANSPQQTEPFQSFGAVKCSTKMYQFNLMNEQHLFYLISIRQNRKVFFDIGQHDLSQLNRISISKFQKIDKNL
jgi:3-deoxy-D-arabino-heptulosonate 7-phosphate (DAHP) synthase